MDPPAPPPGPAPFSATAAPPPGVPPARLPSVPQRFHPLSIVVRLGRAVLLLVWVFVIATAQQSQQGGGSHNYLFDYVLAALIVAGGVIAWLVTRWYVEGDVLEVSTGLIRRKVTRLPLARIQAVDIVEPWLARLLGLAEVRVRSGSGGSGDARLQYLTIVQAQAVRSALMARVHGLPTATPEAIARPLVRVDNGRLVLSSLVSSGAMFPAAMLVAAASLAAAGLRGFASGIAFYGVLAGIAFARRIANLWGFSVGEAPDGLRVQTGLGSRVRETIPVTRVQAVRVSEPLIWRIIGWQGLGVHLAGALARKKNQPRSAVIRSLLPVGGADEAGLLLYRVLGRTGVPMAKPPARARLRAPLSYHFLAAATMG